jgi:hypothetical protein
MIKQIDHALDPQFLELLCDLRTNALERLHLGEQRVEDFGPHAIQ